MQSVIHDFLRNSASVSLPLVLRASSNMASMPRSLRTFCKSNQFISHMSLKKKPTRSKQSTQLTVRQVLYLSNSASQSFDVVLPRRYSVLLSATSQPLSSWFCILSLYHLRKQVSYFLQSSKLAPIAPISRGM